jgi:DNA-binding FrmR family transcriptional regulator
MGKSEEEYRALRNRVRRLLGQVTALEKQIQDRDPLLPLTQIEAVIAAAKGIQKEFVYSWLLDETTDPATKRKLIERLIKRG